MRKFGIEIEMAGNANTMQAVAAALVAEGVPCIVAGYTHATSPTWKIVRDGSVVGCSNPMELVSPILDGEEGMAQVKLVGQILSRIGCSVNRSTGLHVHVDARDLSVEQIKNVLRIWVKYEANYDSIMPASRRGDSCYYARSVVGALGGSVDAAFDRIARMRATDGRSMAHAMGGRYFKVNLESLVRHGTIEVRHHAGSVDPVKLEMWARTVNAIVCRAAATRAVKKTGAGDFGNAFKHAGGSVMRWARRRAANFDAAGRVVRGTNEAV
jgi:hypothetical protein